MSTEQSPTHEQEAERELDDFDGIADFWEGWYSALKLVRERLEAGGPGWEPKG